MRVLGFIYGTLRRIYVLLLVQLGVDVVGDSTVRRCCRLVVDVLTQSLSVSVLDVNTEDRLTTSLLLPQSAIRDAIVNADAFADIAAACVTVAMVTEHSASAVVVCIILSARCEAPPISEYTRRETGWKERLGSDVLCVEREDEY